MAENNDLIGQYVPEAELVGEARLKFLFWNVYDAKLHAKNGTWSSDAPFALSLKYLRDLSGEDIAKRSIDEIRLQGFNDEDTLASWHEILQGFIPDVSETSTIIGIQTEKSATVLYHNNQLIGQVDDPLFTLWFFSIWLSEKTSEPAMRRKLIGK